MFIEKIVNVTNLQIYYKALVFTVYLQCQTAKSTVELVSPKKGNTSDGFVPFDIKRSLIV